jgi:hypothetical protein
MSFTKRRDAGHHTVQVALIVEEVLVLLALVVFAHCAADGESAVSFASGGLSQPLTQVLLVSIAVMLAQPHRQLTYSLRRARYSVRCVSNFDDERLRRICDICSVITRRL